MAMKRVNAEEVRRYIDVLPSNVKWCYFPIPTDQQLEWADVLDFFIMEVETLDARQRMLSVVRWVRNGGRFSVASLNAVKNKRDGERMIARIQRRFIKNYRTARAILHNDDVNIVLEAKRHSRRANGESK